MTDLPLTRRTLLATGLAAGAAGLWPAARAAIPSPGGTLVLANVRLETGYRWDGGEVAGTLTAPATVVIERGAISRILPAGAAPPAGLPVHDGQGMLLLPAFRDMHVHLDKTFYGGPWVPPRKRRGIPGQIALEQKLLPAMLPRVEDGANRLVTLLQSKGTTFARSQCNVDPVIGTRHVELLRHALDQRAATFGYEIVAFPQHGFISADMVAPMRRAMELGATHVGGIDPTTVDGGMERSVDAMLQIAVDCDKGVDIHLHEPGESGIAAIRRICDRVEREPKLRGRVTISHGFALASLPEPEITALAARMAPIGMSVASTIPLGARTMPIPILLAQGVRVYAGTDSIMSHWSMMGTGDVLEKANLACQLYGWNDELGFSQALRLATGGPIPLSAKGEQLWPKAGDPADVVLVAASCAAETVARQTPRSAVLHRGTLAAGTLA